jgi:hypothetical protein
MLDSEHFHKTTKSILNDMEFYFHFSLYFHTLFLKSKCIHLSSEVSVTKQAKVAGNVLKCFSEVH